MLSLRKFVSNREYLGGLLTSIAGLWVVEESASYQIGTLANMGPGFFPLALGIILVTLGAILFLSGIFVKPEDDKLPRQDPEWRAWLLIALSIEAFIFVGRHLGLMPATFAITFIAALADRENTIRDATVLALAICLVCLIVFWLGLRIQFPLFRWM